MQKHFLFFNLFFIIFVAWPHTALAKKKYRYIKREHGVRFHWDNLMNIEDQKELMASVNIQGAYTYNWRGMLEAGPYFKIASQYKNKEFKLNEFDGGLLAEYNIIKNRGKREFIPAVGLSLGINNRTDERGATSLFLSGGLHGALKIFVAKRTPFVVMLGCKILTPMGDPQGLFQKFSFNPYTSMGFSYYFDFY